MAGKFGADFNPSQPSNSDLVKKGAQWIRDIKTRLKATFGVCFNLETGNLLDNVVPSASLKTLNPDPSGTFSEVDVNNKGQVTAGRNPVKTVIVKPYAWMYFFEQGLGPDNQIIARSLTTDTDGLQVASYSFATPAGVNRLKVRVYGAGGGGGYGAAAGGGGGGGYTETLVDVSEGDVFLVWAGEGGIGMDSIATPAKNGALSKFQRDAFQYAQSHGGLAGIATAPGAPGRGETTSSVAGWGPNFDLYGAWGTKEQGGMGAGGAGGGNGFIGTGGLPVNSGAKADDGGGGCVIVEYWKE